MTSETGMTCTKWCWVIGGLAGILAAVLLFLNGGFSVLPALIAGIVLAVILGLLLSRLFCSDAHVSNSSAAAGAAAATTAGAALATNRGAKLDADQDVDLTDYDGDGVSEGVNEGTRPAALDGPRGGKADNLKEIKGVGPKLEKLLNSLGFYHFDQVAAWSGDEVAWVDVNLQGFKGRVSRDEWVDQAKVLATGGQTEFSKKVDKGEVY